MLAEIRSLAEYQEAWKNSIHNPESFWKTVAESFYWFTPFTKVKEGDFKQVNMQWFVGGQTNLCYNCIDRHLPEKANQTALIVEPNDPATPAKVVSYQDLYNAVCMFANALEKHGIKSGDRVCLYMPNGFEAAVAMLACTRIGAIHSVVFGGFSARALADRIHDTGSAILITADSIFRGNKEVSLKAIADEACQSCPSIQSVIVLKHTGSEINWNQGRDIWWHDFMENQPSTHTAVAMDAEAPLFILYTSGSTGKPKGIVHTTGGYMVYIGYTFRNIFQSQPQDIYFCTADVGWVTGHSYGVYGPLLNGITSVLFEGVPTWPNAGRFWEIVDKFKINILYTAPTAIRALEAFGAEWPAKYSLVSLRILGTVGEPINVEAWNWYHKQIGKEKCPIVDTWWQTETGGIMISNLAGVTAEKPTFATLPFPGIDPVLVDENGKEITDTVAEGRLCIRSSWPGVARTTWRDHERFKQTYFSTFPGLYYTGDGCRRDEGSFYRITGRVDDVVNVSGHRIGTAEVESALAEHPAVIESAVVGYPHEVKGQGLYAFVICEPHHSEHPNLIPECQQIIAQKIGSFAKLDFIQVVPGLPKTRSGKIMRRILRKIVEGETQNFGDTTSLLDPTIVQQILTDYQIIRNKHTKP